MTDCNAVKAVKAALAKKDINPRISQWCLMLQNYDYLIEHRPADRMRHVDAFSCQCSGGKTTVSRVGISV